MERKKKYGRSNSPSGLAYKGVGKGEKKAEGGKTVLTRR